MVDFKTFDVQMGKQTITTHILPKISRSKGNHNDIWSANKI